MANFNKVILAGNTTRDPELKNLPSGTQVCEFGMAINRKWKDQGGSAREDVCFVDLKVFGKPAETFNQYVKKGDPVLIEGRLQFYQWEGKDGAKRTKLSVVVESFQFLGGRKDGGMSDRSAPYREPREIDQPVEEDIPF